MSRMAKALATSAACIALVAAGTTTAAGHAVQRTHELRAWPAKATAANIKKRVGAYNWSKAHRVAVCETGKTVNWYLTGKYRGALGMYRGTWNYGVLRTRYKGTTWPEQVAIAVAAHPITGGWRGWGCGSA